MAIVPLRDVGKLGIITDADPFDLPVNAYSFGKNIRFENNRIERGPVFRTAGSTLKDPRAVFGYTVSSGTSKLLVASKDGSVSDWETSAETDVSPAAWVPADSDVPSSVVSLNSTIFVNREDHVPWFRAKDGTGDFSELPSGTGQWDPTWRAKVLTSVAGVLVALNVTKGPTSLPNDVLWSNFVPLGSTPDWDIGGTTSSAGENTLAEMREPIIDGLALRNRLMIFGHNETWSMEYIGGNSMFSFARQFDKGVIAPNCVVDTNNIHYVFGSNDIWMHDGVSMKSIAQGRVRRFIYESMRLSEKQMFFTAHNPDLNEVIFCYVSDDAYLKFPSGSSLGCNRGAVYNYAADTWYFVDLPYVTCSTLVTLSQGQQFDTQPVTWNSSGGSWAAQEGETKLSFVFGNWDRTSLGLPRGLRTYAPYTAAATAFPVDPVATVGAYLIRTGLDMDELGAELRGYKLVSSIYPQIRMNDEADPLEFTLGSSDLPNGEPLWGITQTYDSEFYKLDHNIAGRFLDIQMVQTDFRPFSVSGFDFDVTLLGVR